MTKNIKKTLALILSVIMLMSAMPMSLSMATSYGDFEYSKSGSDITITKYNGSETEVVIPEKISVYTVVAVGDDSNTPFKNNSKITSVVIPDTVKTISSGAFFRCDNLQTVIIGSGVTKIDSNAFRYCANITTVKYKGSETQWNSIEWGINNGTVKECDNIEFYYGVECGDGSHLITFIDKADATCTTNGNVAHWYCEACKKAFSNEEATQEIADVVIPAKHTLSKTQASAPNCAEEGNVEYWNCSVCGKNYEDEAATKELDEVTLDKNDSHSYPDNWTFNPETGKHEKVCANDATHILSEACSDSDSDDNCLCDACGVLVAHDFSVANCTTPATCSVCVTVDGGIDADNHSLTKTDANDFTCTANGNKEYWYCSLCKKYFKDAEATTEYAENEWVTLAEHKTKYVSAKAATCKDDGNVGHWYCEVCNSAFKFSNATSPLEDVTIPATGAHTYDEGAVTTEPGCTTLGVKTYTCTLEGCGATRTEDIDATNHTFGTTKKAKAATCVAKGYEAYKQCTVCKLYFAAAAEVTSTAGEELESAFDTAINPDNHSFSKTFTVDVKATCETAGSKSKHCTRTGCTAKSEATEIAKRDHVLVDTTQATAPNCTDEGAMNQECTNVESEEYAACDYTTTIPIPATGHTEVENFVQDATCTQPGKKGAKYCTICKTFTTAEEEIAPLGHDWEELEGHDPATCIKDGKNNLRCKREGCGVTNTEEVKASHTYPDEWHVAKTPDCTENGVQRKLCSVCSDVTSLIEEAIPATGHTFGEVTPAVPATCVADGNEAYKQCSVCELYFAADAEVTSTEGKESAAAFNLAIDAENHIGTTYNRDEDIVPGTCKAEKTWNEVTYCAGCNAEFSSVSKTGEKNPANHDGGTHRETEDIVAGTCNAEATWNEVIYCQGCDAELRTIPMTGERNPENHIADRNIVDEDIVYGTCIAVKTWNEVTYCAGCDEELGSEAKSGEIDPDNHDLEATDAEAPTCETDGNIAYWICSDCDKIFDKAEDGNVITDVVDPAIGHAYGDWTFDADGKHKKVCANDETHIVREDCADVATDEDCLCDVCDELVEHDFTIPTCDTLATCTVCNATTGEPDPDNHVGETTVVRVNEVAGTCSTQASWTEITYCVDCDEIIGTDAKEGELNPENHFGAPYIQGEDYVPGTCMSVETWNEVTRCGGCHGIINSIPKTGIKDPNNHDWSDVIIPNAGKDMLHYVQCQRTGCGAVLAIPHNSGHVNIVEQATCQKDGLQYSFCYICKNDIYTVIPKAADHKDANADKKCDWCNTSLQPSEPSQPENPGEPSAPQDPSANCRCGCHATGGKKLFFRVVIFFQKIFGFNKVCDCGTPHY